MADICHFAFTQDVGASAFSKTLSLRVDEYFRTQNMSKQANGEMVLKTILGFVLWTATWYWLMTAKLSSLGLICAYVIHGFAQLYMAFNIAHDANHGAYSKNKRINRAVGYVFDLVGISSYMWRLLHNDSHHAFVNIRGADTTLISGDIFRFCPTEERRPHHRYQHLYAPALYSLSTLDWVLTKDYRWLFYRGNFGNRKAIKHSPVELFFLFAGKAFYYTYVLILPLRFIQAPWYIIVLGFVVMHLFLGFTIALIFQPNHFNEKSTFPAADQGGRISNNHIQHIFDTTSDYARGNRSATWILGGLNLHVIHHMYAGICHVHYPALTRILMSTAEEFGLTYQESPTLSRAFMAHLRWLKALGSSEHAFEAPAQSPSMNL